ncbi:PGPGW domain-containing protein [Leucobacter sp. UCMA 4100]|uniref:PGPGW domain-containing protein n=1 Tax=Leucobacter sp. UCMA 4100 TaxID=2810534 RepID=UPI0022EB8112|nr:PGPGW domain-containing protein [Leucobacter sp. UCMA 4100]
MPDPRTRSPEDHPGWMKRLAARVGGFLERFKAIVGRRPWLALAYKITVAVIGGVVILAGIAMLVLPGPGWLTIFLGLAILGSEFAWARNALTRLRIIVQKYADRYRWWRARRKVERSRAREA